MTEQVILESIRKCVEFGKINKQTPFPPDMKDQDGADELTSLALNQGVKPDLILDKGLVPAMELVGQKFSDGKIFVPQMLMSAKAMSASMMHLKPYFQSGEVKAKGTFIIGTVKGDLHDIGKNLVAMMVEGAGWKIIDLGVDVSEQSFADAVGENPEAVVGLSALLTTTMVNMESIVKSLKEANENVKVLVGGAPLSEEFCNQINADFYSPDPKGAVEYLNSCCA